MTSNYCNSPTFPRLFSYFFKMCVGGWEGSIDIYLTPRPSESVSNRYCLDQEGSHMKIGFSLNPLLILTAPSVKMKSDMNQVL